MQNPTLPELSALQLQKIDDLCNAFEQAFKTGKTPRAEESLTQADETLRKVLLPELIQLEKHYRPDCSTAELSSRFPQLEQAWLNELTGSTQQQERPSIPGYVIIEELGRGGMGVVYLAADLNLDRQVALKMIHRSPQVSAELRRRFLGEARAAARLHHPNLVQIFDAGECEGYPFLVLEFVEGCTLAERIRDRPLTYKESAKLLETLCLGLQFAHDRHIVHRDLKPSNILMGRDGVPRISDFGLAKRLDEDVRQTVSGLVVGTPSYMAPEQAVGLSGASSPAVDVYSLGAILYELLTGQPPFRAASVMETLEQLRTKDPVPPRRICDNIPRDQIDLGNALTNWSGELVAIGRREEAISALQRSVDIHRKATSSQPDVNSYQTSLALVLAGLANQLWETDLNELDAWFRHLWGLLLAERGETGEA